MKRLALLAIAVGASSLPAAPVPKELKANNSPAGAWQLVNPDPQKPGQFLPSNQFWIIDAEYGVIFGGTPTPGVGAKPTEVFKCDSATMELDHYYSNDAKRNYGVLRIERGSIDLLPRSSKRDTAQVGDGSGEEHLVSPASEGREMKRYDAFVWLTIGSASSATPVPKELAKPRNSTGFGRSHCSKPSANQAPFRKTNTGGSATVRSLSSNGRRTRPSGSGPHRDRGRRYRRAQVSRLQ